MAITKAKIAIVIITLAQIPANAKGSRYMLMSKFFYSLIEKGSFFFKSQYCLKFITSNSSVCFLFS